MSAPPRLFGQRALGGLSCCSPPEITAWWPSLSAMLYHCWGPRGGSRVWVCSGEKPYRILPPYVLEILKLMLYVFVLAWFTPVASCDHMRTWLWVENFTDVVVGLVRYSVVLEEIFCGLCVGMAGLEFPNPAWNTDYIHQRAVFDILTLQGLTYFLQSPSSFDVSGSRVQRSRSQIWMVDNFQGWRSSRGHIHALCWARKLAGGGSTR